MRSPLDKVCQLWTSRVPRVNSPRMTIPTIYSACPVENPTRNHFGLTGAWSRVRSHMGSAYFSLPSVGAQPNMQKAQCRGQPGCALSTSPGMHEGILQRVVLPKKIDMDGESQSSTASMGASGRRRGSKSCCWQTTSTSSATSQQKLILTTEATSRISNKSKSSACSHC